jgi:Domain of unknown function (DUF4259)
MNESDGHAFNTEWTAPGAVQSVPFVLTASGLAGDLMVRRVGSWGVASFENDAAGDWFLLVEEAPDPGAVMASAIDDVVSAAEFLEVGACCEAVAAAEPCACCAGQLPDRLPDDVDGWVQANTHGPHADEVEVAVRAVTRVREASELRDLWEDSEHFSQWLAEADHLLSRLGRSSAGSPPSVSP